MPKIGNIITILLLVILYSCGGDYDAPEEGEDKVTVTSEIEQSIAAIEGSVTLRFTASGDWNAFVTEQSAQEWCTISPTTGSSTTTSLTVTFKANTTDKVRKAVVRIVCGEAHADVTFTQDAALAPEPGLQTEGISTPTFDSQNW